MPEFNPALIQTLHRPQPGDPKTSNGQLTIIAGSDLFHGPALFSLLIATRVVDMVFFTSPTPEFEHVAHALKSRLGSFIWVPFDQVDSYIAKSNAILLGPGLKRYHHDPSDQTLDSAGQLTRDITLSLTSKFPNQQWIIDAGSLQVIKAYEIPPHAIITPNSKEFEILFEQTLPTDFNQKVALLTQLSSQYSCHIVAKGDPMVVVSPSGEITTNDGSTPVFSKGGTGDCLAALIASLVTQNPPHLSAIASDYIAKTAAGDLATTFGPFFSADDLANQIPITLHKLLSFS